METLTLLLFLGVAGANIDTENNYRNDPQIIESTTRKSTKCGLASWYGDSLSGKLTASGQRFDPNGLTAASWTHRFGSRVTVTNPANGRSVTVRINDRGPAKRLGRIIDLSKAAFRSISRLQKGLIRVCIR